MKELTPDASDFLTRKKRDILLAVQQSKGTAYRQVENKQMGFDNGAYTIFSKRGLDGYVTKIPTPPAVIPDILLDLDGSSADVFSSGLLNSITVSWVALAQAKSYKLFWKYSLFIPSNGTSKGKESVKSPIQQDPALELNGSQTNVALYQEQTGAITGTSYTINSFNIPSGYNSKYISVFVYAYTDLAATVRLTKFPKTLMQFDLINNKIYQWRTSYYNGTESLFVDNNTTADTIPITEFILVSKDIIPVPDPDIQLDLGASSAHVFSNGTLGAITVAWDSLVQANSYKVFWRYSDNIRSNGQEIVNSPIQQDPALEVNGSQTNVALYQEQTGAITGTSYTINSFNIPSGFNSNRISVFVYAYTDLAATVRLTKFPKTLMQFDLIDNKIYKWRTTYFAIDIVSGVARPYFVDDDTSAEGLINSYILASNDIIPVPVPLISFDLPTSSATINAQDELTSVTVSWSPMAHANSYKLFWKYGTAIDPNNQNKVLGNDSVTSPIEQDPELETFGSTPGVNLYQGQSSAITGTSYTLSSIQPPAGSSPRVITIFIYGYSDIAGTTRITEFPTTALQFYAPKNKKFIWRTTRFNPTPAPGTGTFIDDGSLVDETTSATPAHENQFIISSADIV